MATEVQDALHRVDEELGGDERGVVVEVAQDFLRNRAIDEADFMEALKEDVQAAIGAIGDDADFTTGAATGWLCGFCVGFEVAEARRS